MLWLHGLKFCSVVSEEQLSILLETGSGQFGLDLQLYPHFFSPFLFYPGVCSCLFNQIIINVVEL